MVENCLEIRVYFHHTIGIARFFLRVEYLDRTEQNRNEHLVLEKIKTSANDEERETYV